MDSMKYPSPNEQKNNGWMGGAHSECQARIRTDKWCMQMMHSLGQLREVLHESVRIFWMSVNAAITLNR